MEPKDTQAELTIAVDEETLAAIDEGLKSTENSRTYTWDEVAEFARARRKEWQTIPERRSA